MACCEYIEDMRNVVFCWGNTYNGELGLGGIEEVNVVSPCCWTNFMPNVCDIACGKNHTVVLLNDGTVFSCGKNDRGQLGHTEAERKLGHVKSLSVHFINQIKCGSDHSLALSEAGQVFAWGSNNYGQLGLGCDDDCVPVPKIIKSLAMFTVIQITCGAYHSMALTSTGEIYSWGFNTYGQLGIGTAENHNKPWLVASLTGIPIAHIAAGGCHSLVLTTSGGLFSWGKNKFGQLGLNDEEDRWYPTSQKSLRSQHVKYISCGEDYTSCLTQEGGVFTFGAGMYGQLGHASKSNEILPRKVIELMGSVVTQIVCGRCHTLVYVPNGNRIYTFGLGGSGQLGTGNLESSTTPVPLPELIWDKQDQSCPCTGANEQSVVNVRSRSPLRDSPKRNEKDEIVGSTQFQVFKIINGGDQSFALTTYTEDKVPPQDFRIYDKRFQITVLDVECLKEIKNIRATDCVPQELMSYIETVFSSSACINGSFLKPKEICYDCSSKNHGIDINAAITGFCYIEDAENSSIPDLIAQCLEMYLLPNLSPEPPDAEVLRLYLTLPLCHLFKETKQRLESLICPFAKALLSLNQRAAKLIDIWWSQLDVQYFRNILQIYKSCVINLLESLEAMPGINHAAKRKYLHLCLGVMKKLNKVNIENREIVPYQEFYISEVTEKVDIRHDYAAWLRTPNKGDSLFFCDYPFVFDAPAKTLILQADSAMQMQSAMNSAFQQNFVSAFVPIVPANPFLVLIVTRENIVQDTINQLAKHDQSDLKKPLKVIFHGEEAVDAGGVRKEFFLLLLREALDPKYGMFTEYPETRCIWFHAKTFQEDDQMFYLIGILCGLAIYNFTIIDLPFPLVLYKKLLNEKVQLKDLQDLSPPIAKGLQDLLDYEGDDVEDVFVLNFEISLEVYGSMVSFELKPGGKDIAVSKQNRAEYVDKYIDFILNTSILDAFQAFSQGFHKVCGGKVLELFHAQELMTLVIGNEEYDWDELEKHADYKNEYDANHPAIKKFWNVFHRLTLEQKKKFLLFLTGSDRIPILGMKSVKITFQPMHVTDDHLPVAHTCFNILDLPHYTTEEILHTKLLQAIEHTQGFGLA